MTQPTYEAELYSRTVKYRNHNGETKEETLFFMLDPIQLMRVIAGTQTQKSKSKNPAKQGQAEDISEDEQLRIMQDLAAKAAGNPSEDGEHFYPIEDFKEWVAGKAFMTQLAASDGDREEFAEKVVLNPFRSFVEFAKADPSNDAKETQQFDVMLKQMENIFKPGEAANETIDDRRARLAAELQALSSADE